MRTDKKVEKRLPSFERLSEAYLEIGEDIELKDHVGANKKLQFD